MPKLHIFFLSGVDGSGKSTHAKLLYVYAKKNGLKTRYLWLRWSPFLTYTLFFYALIRKRTIKMTLTKNDQRITFKAHLFWTDPILRKIYPRGLLFDSLLRYLLELLFAYVRCLDLIVIDRFFLDIVVDLLWEIRDIGFLRYVETRVILKLISKYKHCGLVLFANPLVVITRKKDIVSFKEISFKYSVFKLLAKMLGLETWDTTDISLNETFKAVRRYLDKCMCNRRGHNISIKRA